MLAPCYGRQLHAERRCLRAGSALYPRPGPITPSGAGSIGTWPGSAATRAEPIVDGRVAPEVEPALVRNVGVGVESHVGDGHRIPAEPAGPAQVPLHHRERGVPAILLRRQLGALQVRHLAVLDPVARDRDVRLVAVLFEEQPLQGQRPLPPLPTAGKREPSAR